MATRFREGGRLKKRMKNLRKILMILSGILCCLFLIMLPISYRFSLWKSDAKSGKLTSNESTIQIAPHFKIELSHGGLIFFTSEVPYLSGTRHLADEKGVLYKGGHTRAFRKTFCYVFFQEILIGEKNELVEIYRSADLPGVHYRYFNVT